MPARIMPPTLKAVLEAASRLRNGGMAVFPTETVYGLGANALDAEAVRQIFAAKGRPQTNPVIVHVADADAALGLVSEWPDRAQTLAEAFWPGPLTLVLPKSPAVPDVVTAGGQTVGVRVPSHPVALELLREAGVPLAAPSANRSEEVSPTMARHVAESLGNFLDDLLILDGGPCAVGLESTVLDVTGEIPRILRPGMITAQMLREVIGEVWEGAQNANEPERSPGQMLRHYAPRKPLLIVPANELQSIQQKGDGIWFCLPPTFEAAPGIAPFVAPPGAENYARALYRNIRQMDEAGNISRIVIEEPPRTPEWAAVHDRLRRASAPKIP